MDTRQLQAFCAVVERESFSQAAERLGVTQPAVSLQVRALEEEVLGVSHRGHVGHVDAREHHGPAAGRRLECDGHEPARGREHDRGVERLGRGGRRPNPRCTFTRAWGGGYARPPPASSSNASTS